MKIGLMELVIVFIVALVLIGPDKLPGFAKKLGAAIGEFKKAAADVTKEVHENIIDPLEEAQKPLREAADPLEELDREVKSEIRDLEKDIRDIGKAKPQVKSEPEGGSGGDAGTDKDNTGGEEK